MADTKCKTCRRAGEKLFLKGDRCFTPSCAFERKAYPPGKRDSERKHRSVTTEYGLQLREKQKIKNIYRVAERQFARYVKSSALKSSGNPAEGLYAELESRLDSVAYRAGFAKSRAEARQLVSHGHVLVNGRRVTIPSYRVSAGDILSTRKASESKAVYSGISERLGANQGVPSWIKIDPKDVTGTIMGKPSLSAEHGGLNFKSVIEFYSR